MPERDRRLHDFTDGHFLEIIQRPYPKKVFQPQPFNYTLVIDQNAPPGSEILKTIEGIAEIVRIQRRDFYIYDGEQVTIIIPMWELCAQVKKSIKQITENDLAQALSESYTHMIRNNEHYSVKRTKIVFARRDKVIHTMREATLFNYQGPDHTG